VVSLSEQLSTEKINLEIEKKKTLAIEAEISKNQTLKKAQNQVIENLMSMQLAYKSKYEEGNFFLYLHSKCNKILEDLIFKANGRRTTFLQY